MSLFFEAYSRDLPVSTFVPVSALIAGDTSGFLTPIYAPNDCPTATFLVAQNYVSSVGPLYRIAVYSSRGEMMSPYSRPTASLTSGPAVP